MGDPYDIVQYFKRGDIEGEETSEEDDETPDDDTRDDVLRGAVRGALTAITEKSKAKYLSF